MKSSSTSFKAACLFALAGLGMGIGMAASQDHSLMPAHAHLNLLGWVSLFLFGVYYRLHPALETSRLAMTQIVVWSVGTTFLTVAVAALHLGHTAFEPVAAVSALLLFGSLGLFTVLVFRSGSPAQAATRVMTAAE
ncbi:hypothetical protein J2848_003569 [Azospirillum lipoferum]|uniref:Uncharacterized protein n=1 Tax=Azospirillum lipoferum TaxID=193 RepID=A0A5A9GLC2_AZOLI|nr:MULTISPECIES: hypothetical protein [Azospirillum]KAA0595236.1 hypothetical protein FZ942_16470 [Azospirillum lipoferum]MCP1611891.1 hypothetical protein [Azospirillum lipoferum]MDW5533350.1 hypothetical protein [Azospirillum sp. NL1]